MTDHLEDGVVSAMNWSEVLRKIAVKGGDANRIGEWITALGVAVVSVDEADARRAAPFYGATRAEGLTLPDRACLALAQRRDDVAVTADEEWATVDCDVAVRLIR